MGRFGEVIHGGWGGVAVGISRGRVRRPKNGRPSSSRGGGYFKYSKESRWCIMVNDGRATHQECTLLSFSEGTAPATRLLAALIYWMQAKCKITGDLRYISVAQYG